EMDPAVASGTMPDWSPSGNTVVFAKPGASPIGGLGGLGGFGGVGMPGISAASLEVMPWDGSAFAASTTLVPAGGPTNYSPSYSPDGNWIIFNRSPSGQNSYDALDAEVWVANATDGTAIKLAAASTGPDSWPKWVQGVQRYQGRTLFWFTFSSRRSYGLRLVQ